MSDEPTERDVEALATELRERDTARQLAAGGPGSIASADTPRTTASDIIASEWYAERIAQARREGEQRQLTKRERQDLAAVYGYEAGLADGRREGAAEALEQAAFDVVADCSNQPGPCICTARHWLRDRAATLRGDA